ncbi:MAG: 50S ribosomal protein L29 [Planctomycetota bacterium]|nr:50S ribosomal protein L29 [Planctomycetota bacterium]
MRTRDIRRRETGDLEQEIVRLREEIFQQRFRGQSEEKVDRGMVRKHRRDIARITTILKERQLGINKDLEAEAGKGK